MIKTTHESSFPSRPSVVSLLSNFSNPSSLLEKHALNGQTILTCDPVPDPNEPLRALRTFQKSLRKNILLLNVEEPLLYKLCFLKYLFPWNPCLIISVDLILRAPKNFRQRLLCYIKGILLRKIASFILYHKEVSGYQKYFQISPKKCSYVPFKINSLKEIQSRLRAQKESKDPTEGDYVLVAGRSMRDLTTFVHAMAANGLPGILLRQGKDILSHHGTFLRYRVLPLNIKEIVDHGSERSFIDYLAEARVVVIPRFRNDINATGIATYLMAMALKKCVIISHGPGTTDLLLSDEAILVPPEDVESLSKAIAMAWNDANLRHRIAENGHNYALSLKDEGRLITDILKTALNVYNEFYAPPRL